LPVELLTVAVQVEERLRVVVAQQPPANKDAGVARNRHYSSVEALQLARIFGAKYARRSSAYSDAKGRRGKKVAHRSKDFRFSNFKFQTGGNAKTGCQSTKIKKNGRKSCGKQNYRGKKLFLLCALGNPEFFMYFCATKTSSTA
jgi:hypothetical protein